MIQFFDPREYVRGLQQILISDTKKIGFLFGAGTSLSIKKGASDKSKIPAISEMTKNIVEIVKNNKVKGKTIYKLPLENIISDIIDEGSEGTIEEILTNITQKEKAIGKSTIDGLDRKGWNELRLIVEQEIKSIVSVHKYKNDFISDLIHCDFAHWIKKIQRKFPIEVFTTNYDYLFEIGFEHNDLPYFDGFIGSYQPFFFQSSVEDIKFLPEVTKLWKIHGSLGLDYEGKKIVRRLPDDSTIMIYPSILKYDNSKKQPYISFLDRLGNFLKQDDAVLFVCGYSFGDDHINGMIMHSLEKNPTSHIIALIFDEYKEKDHLFYSLSESTNLVDLAENNSNLSVFGMNGAIIGGKLGIWKMKDKIVEDEDAIILDLFFEDRFASESYLPKYIFTRLENIFKPDSNEIWEIIKKAGYIDEHGIITKEFYNDEDRINLALPSRIKHLEQEIIGLIKYSKEWNGEGVFTLPDFSKFVNFLTNLNSEDYIKKMTK